MVGTPEEDLSHPVRGKYHKKRARKYDYEDDPDLPKKPIELKVEVGMISLGYHFIAGGNAGGDEIDERKAYLNETKSFPSIKQIDMSECIDGRPRKVNEDILVISFSKNHLSGVLYPHDDPLVIICQVHHDRVKRILIDNGSSADVISYNCFYGLGLRDNKLEPYHMPLIRFSRESLYLGDNQAERLGRHLVSEPKGEDSFLYTR